MKVKEELIPWWESEHSWPHDEYVDPEHRIINGVAFELGKRGYIPLGDMERSSEPEEEREHELQTDVMTRPDKFFDVRVQQDGRGDVSSGDRRLYSILITGRLNDRVDFHRAIYPVTDIIEDIWGLRVKDYCYWSRGGNDFQLGLSYKDSQLVGPEGLKGAVESLLHIVDTTHIHIVPFGIQRR